MPRKNKKIEQVCKIDPHIRWMIRKDMREVLQIESGCFEYPWTEGDFIRCLRQRNCIGMVAECDEKVIGFMIYELHKQKMHVLNFAVSPYVQRRGVGTAMCQKLCSKLSQQRRNKITLEVRETNLPAQLFFRNQRFFAISVLRDHYKDTTEDAYLMQFHHPSDQEKKPWINRIARYVN